ncbi:spore-associated protein A [Streptomyces sp. NBC_00250]|uniref:spore-associated protein A n=1 Tax=Streptomyces sp. NBC_00250 TaxID=2903641 RepID=UPI002E2A8003|nr:spore-associated protein A [Streptomyces sp. NBC_00250]
MKRSIKAVTTSLIASGVLLMALPAAASAAEIPSYPGKAQAAAGYNGACGSGYTVIDSLRLESGANVFLTYSASGYNCVVTVAEYPGSPRPMSAWIQRTDDEASRDSDSAEYTAYAGPVYVYAKGSCVDWGGSYAYGKYQQYGAHCD